MTTIPKFSNPYNLSSSTKSCTRAEVFNDSQPDNQTHSTRKRDPDASREELRWLEGYLRESLGSGAPEEMKYESHGGEKEGGKRPRKRRRLEGDEHLPQGHEPSETIFEFRLLSNDVYPRKIDIHPRALCAIEPEYEETTERAEERAKRAREVAVNFDWVLAQSRVSFPASRRGSKRHETVNLLRTIAPASSPLSNILMTERPKAINSAQTSLPRISQYKARSREYLAEAKTRPSPHELKGGLCCTLIPVHAETISSWEQGDEGRRKRRKRGAPPSRRRRTFRLDTRS